uniref:28S ribosomal protein S22, mitochondrial n=1 Tax=Globodera pallida TaxID=36090 RepID=A0A183BYT2_GLOPA
MVIFTTGILRKLAFKFPLALNSSSWCRAGSPLSHLSSDQLELLFVDDRVQKLLRSLTGHKVEKILRHRRVNRSERTHYALMTDNMYREYLSKMEERSSKFLRFVPFKEPRSNRWEVLTHDTEINAFDNSKFIFADISYDATNEDRTVVVREPDGTLRTALPDERDRMNRLYFVQPNRPVKEPALFSTTDEWLQNCLDRDEHEFVLDWACYFFEPDSPKFVELCKYIFDKTLEDNKLEVLYSTRHFGTLAFYLLINGKMEQLLRFFEQKNREDGIDHTRQLWEILACY